MSDILTLIDAIEAGESEQIESTFNSLISDRITDRIQARREELGAEIFETNLDELSKGTLGNYIKASLNDIAVRGAATRQFSIDHQNAKANDDYTEASKKLKMADKTFAKSWRRRKNVAKAVDRLTK